MRGCCAALLAGVWVLALCSGAGAYNDTQPGAVLTDTVNQEWGVSSTETDFTNTTTPGVIAGLACNLTAGKTYTIYGHLSISSPASGGAKVALGTNTGLSATSISYEVMGFAGAAAPATNSTATALGIYEGSAAAYTDFIIRGAIVVNAAGGLIIYGMQNTANATPTKFLVNSVLSCVRVN